MRNYCFVIVFMLQFNASLYMLLQYLLFDWQKIIIFSVENIIPWLKGALPISDNFLHIISFQFKFSHYSNL